MTRIPQGLPRTQLMRCSVTHATGIGLGCFGSYDGRDFQPFNPEWPGGLEARRGWREHEHYQFLEMTRAQWRTDHAA